MQTIIQHVIRGYGPPTIAPVEFGIHYIDVTSGDMYLSRGKTDVVDWGQPLKAAMVDGEEGKTFGWNDGQTWYVLDIGVQPDRVDQMDIVTSHIINEYTASSITQLGQLSSSVIATSLDSDVDVEIISYVSDQLTRVTGVPNGGDALNVLAKLSNADRDAFWLTATRGEVLQSDVDGEVYDLNNRALQVTTQKSPVPTGGAFGDRLSALGWVDSLDKIAAPQIVYPGSGETVSQRTVVIGTPYDTIFNGAQRLYREFIVNGELYALDSDSIELSLEAGTTNTVKCRDVTPIGTSKWTQTTFTTGTAYNVAKMEVELVNRIVVEPVTATINMQTVGDVDDHYETEWVVKDNGTVVWASSSNVEHIERVTIPVGTLTAPNVYTLEARTRGRRFGWSAVVSQQLPTTVTFDGLALTNYGTVGATIYHQDIDAFSRVPDPTPLPPQRAFGCAFSPTGEYFAVAHMYSPYITIYKRAGDTFTKISNPSVWPGDTSYDCAFSPDGTTLAVACLLSPFLVLYTRNGGDVFTKLPNPSVLPPAAAYSCHFSPLGDFLAVAHGSSPFITIYSINGTTFTKIPNPSVLPTGTPNRCRFNATGDFLAVVHSAHPYINIYKRTEVGYDVVTNPNILPTTVTRICRFSPLGDVLVVGILSGPSLIIYNKTGDAYKKVAELNPGLGGCYSGNFSPDGKFFVSCHQNSPHVALWQVTGTSFNRITMPSGGPSGVGIIGCAFNFDSSLLALTLYEGTDTGLWLYSRSGNQFTKINGTPKIRAAHACAFSPNGELLVITTNIAPYTIKTYQVSGTSLTETSHIIDRPTGKTWQCNFSPDGRFFAVAIDVHPFIKVYGVGESVFTPIPNPDVLPPTKCYDVTFSVDGNSLTVSCDGDPYCITYQWDGNKFNDMLGMSHPLSVTSYACSYNHIDGTLAIGLYTFPYLVLYRPLNGFLQRVSNYVDPVPGNAITCSFDPRGDFLVVGHTSAPRLSIYSIDGQSFTLTTGFDQIPSSSGVYSCSFSPDGTYLATLYSSAPFVRVYKREGDVFITMPSDTISQPSASNLPGIAWYYETKPVIGLRSSQ